jgi:hypothetical protein
VNDDVERRIAHNEARFRQVNEAISRGQWPGDAGPAGFRCECGDLGCNQVVELEPSEYEHVRAHPRRFVIVPGHEHVDAEQIVEARPGYAVVEKLDAAGQVADKTDPRD